MYGGQKGRGSASLNRPILSRTEAALFAAANAAAVFAAASLYTQNNELWLLTVALLAAFDLLFAVFVFRIRRQRDKAFEDSLLQQHVGKESSLEFGPDDPQGTHLLFDQTAAPFDQPPRELGA